MMSMMHRSGAYLAAGKRFEAIMVTLLVLTAWSQLAVAILIVWTLA